MGLFGKKKGAHDDDIATAKARPIGVGAQHVAGPAAGYVAPSAPGLSDVEDPPLVQAYVVPDDTPLPARIKEAELKVMSGVSSMLEDNLGAKEWPRPHEGTAIYGITFGRKPIKINTCPVCNHPNGRTRIHTYPNWITWLCMLAWFILFWPLAWVPLVWDKFKKTDHMCIKCNSIVGTVEPLEDCCEKRR